jgi:hypothetical protein
MTKDDLKKFCSDDSDRFWINNPWSIDSYSLATNGYILIRIPRLEDIPENPKAPDCSNLWPPIQPQEWFEIPNLPSEEYKLCEECKGKGKIRYERHGKLEICEDCYGDGKIKIVDQKIPIGNAVFAAWLLRMIVVLPNPKIGPMEKDNPAWIKYDGGDGLIMPMRN